MKFHNYFHVHKSNVDVKFYFHLDAKHPNHGKKNFFCDLCKKGFIYDCSLTQHKKRHCDKPKVW